MEDSPAGESETAEEDEEPLSTITEQQLLNRAEEPPSVLHHLTLQMTQKD